MFVAIKKVCLDFSRAAKEHCAKPVALWDKYGVNVAGVAWVAGNLAQFVFAPTYSLQVISSTAISMAGSSLNIAFGEDLTATRISCFVGVAAMGLFLSPYLIKCDPGSLVSFSTTAAANALVFFAPELTGRFSKSDNILLRHTLGNPAWVTSAFYLISEPPALYTAISQGQFWSKGVPPLLWELGNVAYLRYALSGRLQDSSASTSRLSALISNAKSEITKRLPVSPFGGLREAERHDARKLYSSVIGVFR